MATRQRRSSRQSDPLQLDDEFSDVSQADIEAFLAEQDVEAEIEEEGEGGFLNLQTGAGLGLIGMGVLYTLQQIGIFPMSADLSGLVFLLPWLAGALIILTGLGVLSWSPATRRRKKARARAARIRKRNQKKTVGRRTRPRDAAERRAREAFDKAEETLRKGGKRAQRSLDSRTRTRSGQRKRFVRAGKKQRKVLGVASGIANYLGIEPAIVRILFILAVIFGQPIGLIAYMVLAMTMGKPDDETGDPTVRVVRD